MKKQLLTLALAGTILMQSCATILAGGNAKVNIANGTPANGKIYVDGKYEGQAPHQVTVPKSALKDGVVITVKADGKEQTTKVRRKAMAGWIIADALLSGIVGVGIDFLTGDIYTANPKTVTYNTTEQ